MSDEVQAFVDRGALEQLDASEGEPQSCRFVALGQAGADLNGDIGDTRTLVSHEPIVGVGGPNRRPHPGSIVRGHPPDLAPQIRWRRWPTL